MVIGESDGYFGMGLHGTAPGPAIATLSERLFLPVVHHFWARSFRVNLVHPCA